MTLTDESGNDVAFSGNRQDSSNAVNFEYVYFTPSSPGSYSLGVFSNSGSESDAVLEIFSPSDKLEYQVAKGSVSVPTDAKNVISVGAINYYDERLEPFSSQGPTNHCVQSPVLMGPDAVSTSAYGGSPFYGTSAAAPHVAGMVALIIDKMPKLTPHQILSELVSHSNTEFSSYTSLENVFGFGAANSEFIPNLEKVVTPVKLSDECVTESSEDAFREGNSDQQSKFAVGGIVQQGMEMVTEPKEKVPTWVKNNAAWWSEGNLDDDTFTNAIGYLIDKKIIDIPVATNISQDPDEKNPYQADLEPDPEPIPIPNWIKSNAAWWASDQIDETTFLQGIEYLVKQEIILVN